MTDVIKSDAEGTVTKYFNHEGYGFLVTGDLPNHSEYDGDVFFHISDVDGKAADGWRFSFDIVRSEEGPRATNLTRISKQMKSSPTSRKHKPGVKRSESEAKSDPAKMERQQKKLEQRADDGEAESDSESNNPFTDTHLESKNDLL